MYVCVCVRACAHAGDGVLQVTPTKTISPGKIFHIHSVDWCGRSVRRLRGVERCTTGSWLNGKDVKQAFGKSKKESQAWRSGKGYKGSKDRRPRNLERLPERRNPGLGLARR